MKKAEEKAARDLAIRIWGEPTDEQVQMIREWIMKNTGTKYIDASSRTDLKDYSPAQFRAHDPEFLALLHAAMGLVTEAGEFMDAMKKHLMYGKPIDTVNLIEELGDIQWYVALAMRTLDTDFAEVHQVNLNKLRQRFPEKFTPVQAIDRDVEAERAQMEVDLARSRGEIP